MEPVRNGWLPPPWLKVLVAKDDFYVERNKCKTHRYKYETFFCIQCMSEWFCESCHKDGIHIQHSTVRVFRTSTKPSMCVDDINKLWNTEKIQPFKINNRNVVFLHERESKNLNGCRICQGALKDYDKYKLCSIQCQVSTTSICICNTPFLGASARHCELKS